MSKQQLTLSSLTSSALVFGSLVGFIASVGTLATFAEDGPRSGVAENIASVTRSPVENVSRAGAAQLLGARLAKDGTLAGRLNLTDSVSGAHVVAENLNVKFIQRGSIIAAMKPGPGGVFQVEALSPGTYSLIASGVDGFFTTAVVVLPYEANPDVASGAAIVNPLQIDATVVHPSNIALARKLIRDGVGSRAANVSRQKQVLQASQVGGNAAADPVPLQTPILVVNPDGRVQVRVNDVDFATGARAIAAGTTVHMIQRGVVRGRYQVDQDGSFNARNLVPGQYSLVAVSSQRTFAAVGVVVESSEALSGTVGKSPRLSVLSARVAKLQNGGSSSIDMVPVDDLNSTQDPSQERDQRQPVEGGAIGGGTGGGGGGGFGGGGALGAIGLGAGIAGLATALANQNNNPASP